MSPRAPRLAAVAAALPALTAPHAMLVQPQTGDVPVRRGADDARPVASATKLMTAPVVLERASLDDVFAAVPYSAAAAESRIDLRGRVLARVPLVTAQPVPEVTTAERVADFVFEPATLAVGFVVLAGGALAAVAMRRRRVPTS